MADDSDWFTLTQIAARLPGSRGARRVHPATVCRWILSGCPARDGRRVKLAATRAGSRWLVRESDLRAFFDALAATSAAGATPSPTLTNSADRAARRAAEQLERRGA